jgi:uncharacterized membrane protein
MRNMLDYRKKLSGDEILSMETILGAALQPVTPRPGYVISLNKKVMAFSFPEMDPVEKQSKKDLIVVIVSLLSATLLLGVGVRLVIFLLTGLGIHIGMKRGERKRRALSVQSAT